MKKEVKKQVYFVGAGPGAADLITVRGMKLIGEADVIIYAGSLVNPALLDYAKEGAEVHNSAYMTLEEVIDVMKAAASEGKTVCRLHTGDPSLYGAVREQMDTLDGLGISYESCPGVSAAFGAAAAMDIEYTLPGLSQSLVITRMEGRTAVPEKESIESWAAHGASMAIYLSTGMIEELSRRLIAGGYSEDTAAAIIYKATWPEEEFYRCKVSELAAVAKEHGTTKTALILVGDAIAGEDYGKSKLYDKTFSTEFRKAK
ncbi:MAG: precorrin-4 C(11)-methyltransferase [Mogibacterium sp.]|nr:precorrin-4 C(11)-methyltransferase [Mogibacterium sp.]